MMKHYKHHSEETEELTGIIRPFLDVFGEIKALKENNIKNKFIKRQYLKRMHKMLHKFSEEKPVLTKDNLYEFFIYVNSNSFNEEGHVFRTNDKGTKNQLKVTVHPRYLTANFKSDFYKADFHMMNYELDFEVNAYVIHDDGNTSGVSVKLNRLYSQKPEAEEILRQINNFLVDMIVDYINLYISDIKENDNG